MKRTIILLASIVLMTRCENEPALPEPLVESLICYEEHLEDGTYQMVTIKPDGTEKRDVLNDVSSPLFDHVNAEPKWSFDRKKIVFYSRADFQTTVGDIFIIDRDGSNLKNLTNSLKSRTMPSLSPDETTIVFSAQDEFGNTQIFSKVLTQSDEKQLTSFTSDAKKIHSYFPTWSNDGKKIVFTSNKDEAISNIYYMNHDGTNVKKVTTGLTKTAFGPRLSPDGTTVVYYAYNDDNSVSNIFSIGINGSNKKPLTNYLENDYTAFCSDPCWSPDGTQILFTSHKFNPDSDDIFVMKADGSEAIPITSTSTVKWFPDWK